MGLTLYTNPMSRGRIARWMLEETGAAYDTIYLGYGPDMAVASYRAINPMAKVPALVHDGKVVTECAAICAYLADAFPAAGLAPAPGDRAAYYRWLFFAAGPLEHASTNKALGFEVPAERSGMAGYGDFDRTVAALSAAVADTAFICGEQFTAADVYVGAQISWGLQFGWLPASPAVVDYAARLNARPAAMRAATLDDAAMPAPA